MTAVGARKYGVALDKSRTRCELPHGDPPRPGQERQLGAIFCRIDAVTKDEAGAPLILATRLPHRP